MRYPQSTGAVPESIEKYVNEGPGLISAALVSLAERADVQLSLSETELSVALWELLTDILYFMSKIKGLFQSDSPIDSDTSEWDGLAPEVGYPAGRIWFNASSVLTAFIAARIANTHLNSLNSRSASDLRHFNREYSRMVNVRSFKQNVPDILDAGLSRSSPAHSQALAKSIAEVVRRMSECSARILAISSAADRLAADREQVLLGTLDDMIGALISMVKSLAHYAMTWQSYSLNAIGTSTD